MGRILHSIDRLPPPLLLAEERLTVIPRGERLVVPNRHIIPDRCAKILYFLQADFEMAIVGRPALRIRAGDILFVPLRVMQTYRAVRNAESLSHTLRLLVSPASAADIDPALADALRDIRHLPRGMTPRFHELINQLRTEIENRRPGHRLMVGGLALELLAETLRRIHSFTTKETASAPSGSPPSDAAAATDTHIRRAKEFILENYEKPLTLADIAWSARLSREHLARLFNETTGQTVFDYLTRIRIEAAKSHLCDSVLLVNQIATLSGFTSDALFCRTFKKHTGLTPMAWRRRILKNSGFEPALRYQPAIITEATPEEEDTSNEDPRVTALARKVKFRLVPPKTPSPQP
ncbi:AraC family transcriptional regulator [Opitutaceae bacterium TAV5]|nr:AraC family transcriptional regulator [Opitutaceae bacterium TAV5]